MAEGSEHLVLVSVDDVDQHSLRAFNWYHQHFYRKEHVVGLVHIYASPEMTAFGMHHGIAKNSLDILEEEEYHKRHNEVLKKSASVIQKYQELCTQRGMRTRVFTKEKTDSIGQVICNIANDNHATCIVMGQRGLGTIKRSIFGSVSDYVLHHANVAVLIVPPAKDQKQSK